MHAMAMYARQSHTPHSANINYPHTHTHTHTYPPQCQDEGRCTGSFRGAGTQDSPDPLPVHGGRGWGRGRLQRGSVT